MRVLVLEGDRGAAAAASAELVAAGHEVARCHDGDAPLPCYGMHDGGQPDDQGQATRRCPLDEGSVDVALVARDASRAPLPGGEDGARCALRRFVPLVVHGDVDRSPYADWATVTTGPDRSLVDSLEEARRAPLARHADAARRSLRAVLEQHGLDGANADVTVRRMGPDLHVTLRAGAATVVPRAVADMASVRAAGAVRGIDPHPRVIDVSFDVA
jgi:hypothetical protein